MTTVSALDEQLAGFRRPATADCFHGAQMTGQKA
jgi:hypothetical protein